MQRQRYYYVIKIQYLGFRYHGWQRQPGMKTVEGQLWKTLKFVLGEKRFKILGAGRTDAMVSAREAGFELFLDHEPLKDKEAFLQCFNENLPADIKALHIEETSKGYNVIQDPASKEYVYLFSFGSKNHPFAAPFMASFHEELDLQLMQQGAALFEGKHHFHNYCIRPRPATRVEREVVLSRIEKNTEVTANFFPEKSYLLRVRGKGFLRNQIRLMMGTLVRLGKGEISLPEISRSLEPGHQFETRFIAPASGLMLNKIQLNNP